MTLNNMNELEAAVMHMLLAGDIPLLEILRKQLAIATIVERKYTGVGFFTEFSVPLEAERPDGIGRLVISDVHGEVEGVEGPIGFVLFLANGAIGTLEGFSYDGGPYPTNAKLIRAYYVCGVPNGGLTMLNESDHRDLSWAYARHEPNPNRNTH